MRVAILGTRRGWHYAQLHAAFGALGAEAEFFTVQQLSGRLGPGSPGLLPPGINALLIRGVPAGSLEQVIFRMDALYALERRGMPCINSPKVIEKTVDKFYTTALLEEAGLCVPPTICCEGAEAAMRAFELLGQDVVYKPLFGSCGNGLARVQTRAEAEPLFERLEEAGAVAYLQRFIPCGGSDIRALVLGGRVVASMRRTGADWRANLARGGKASPCTLSPAQEQLAVAAAAAVGAQLAGVDLIQAPEGTFVIEVNGCPGWQGLSTVASVDIAGEIARFVLEMASSKKAAK